MTAATGWGDFAGGENHLRSWIACLLLLATNALADQPLPPLGDVGTVEVDARGVAFVRYERVVEQAPADVWRAITDPASRLRVFAAADLRKHGFVTIRFGPALTERSTITEYDPPRLLVWVNDETQGYPARYFTDRLELAPAKTGTHLSFRTPIGPRGPLQQEIAVGWHVWVDNWQLQLSNFELTRAALDASQTQREDRVRAKYRRQLDALYRDRND